MTIDDATRAQIHAATPHNSTWVSANAGSGKTRVLTDRVARLLFSGTDPQKILCLTYTKAAASEMQNRLFERLGEWAMMPNDALIETLADLGEDVGQLDDTALDAARTLFASALETPGGLKIQTIHAFCDALLRRFPLEAGVSPQFQVLEDRVAEQIKQDSLDYLAEHAPDVFRAMAEYLTAADPDSLVREILSDRAHFSKEITADTFGVPPSETSDVIVADLLLDGARGDLEHLTNLLSGSGKNDQKAGLLIKAALAQSHVGETIKLLESVFLFGATAKAPFGAKVDGFPTKALREAHPDLMDRINPLMMRLEDGRKRRLALQAWQKTQALYGFARTYLGEYDRRKTARGLLDYDDLIQKTKVLLGETSLAQWVLYRLDGGIDHILVDEAQDTSPSQWEIIKRLAEEFTSGLGASDAPRTIFVVGDEKQSIYSFQGADPAEFTHMQDHFRDRLAQADAVLNDAKLLHSFRSAEPILQLVDAVFADLFRSELAKDPLVPVPEDSEGVKHHAFFDQQAGRIDVWPFLETETEASETPWYQPVDTPSPQDPRQILAKNIAEHVSDLLARKQMMRRRKGTSLIRPKDILILVQRRSTLFHALIKEMKAAGLPVAGADRLEIGAELAVQDVLSLMRFMATPEDNLSLAEVLRSPLIGLSEEQLFEVAHGRKGSLWEHLRGLKDVYPDTLAMLWDMLNRADFLRPYELIERVLTRHKGREQLVAQLGGEAEDGLDELLSQAMRYEQVEAPTLTGFLTWFDAGRVEIKREMDSQSDQIRVMTVHGAKGLEAPIVILPDTADSRGGPQKQLVELQGGGVAWKLASTDATPVQAQAQADKAQFEQQERLRLLYVAMTRAESWLIVCGAGRRNKNGEDWYSRIESGLKMLDPMQADHPTGKGLVVHSADWDVGCDDADDDQEASTVPMPLWWDETVAAVPRNKDIISPSKLEGAKALFDEGQGDDGLLRGTQIHTLLEHLPLIPKENWAAACNALVPDVSDDVIKQAVGVLEAEELQGFFTPETLAEVPIVVPYGPKWIEGVVDRLIVTDHKVTGVDFKSNAVVPNSVAQTPAGLLAQMGAYLYALQQIYPDHEVEVGLLWTRSAEYMPLPHKIVMEAFVAATAS